MKKKISALLISFSMIMYPLMHAVEAETQRFKDKPVLTHNEKKRLSRSMMALYPGISLMIVGITGLTPLGKLVPFSKSDDHTFLQVSKEMMKWILELMMLTTPISVPTWFVLQKLIPKKMVAIWYKTSYQIVNVCFYYNINIGQYRTILTAAEQRKKEGLLAAINELYPKRFGADWQTRMKTFFAIYNTQEPKLIAKGSFATGLTEDERDFVRMVELGAAMANLFYGIQPDRKKALDAATKLYQELGFLS